MLSTNPVTFEEAWSHVMGCTTTREWAFNSEPPTAMELMRTYENGPYTISYLVDVDNKSPFQDAIYEASHRSLYCNVRTLPYGTSLGLVLNNHGVHVLLPVFCAYDECFREARTTVVRYISSAVKGRLYAMEFIWSVSGALAVKFHELISHHGHVLMNPHVVAFPRESAQYLSQLAFIGVEMKRLDNLMLAHPRYVLKIMDTSLQSSCVFCAARGLSLCSCPSPMKRRSMQSSESPLPCSLNNFSALWTEIANIQFAAPDYGSYLLNLFRVETAAPAQFLWSSIVPFRTRTVYGIYENALPHQFLVATGSTLLEPTRNIPSDPRKKYKRRLDSFREKTQQIYPEDNQTPEKHNLLHYQSMAADVIVTDSAWLDHQISDLSHDLSQISEVSEIVTIDFTKKEKNGF